MRRPIEATTRPTGPNVVSLLAQRDALPRGRAGVWPLGGEKPIRLGVMGGAGSIDCAAPSGFGAKKSNSPVVGSAITGRSTTPGSHLTVFAGQLPMEGDLGLCPAYRVTARLQGAGVLSTI